MTLIRTFMIQYKHKEIIFLLGGGDEKLKFHYLATEV